MSEGADISEHQGDLPPEWFEQFEFVIIRAFNENGIPDRTFKQNWERAKGRTLRGVYGWPVPGGENVGLGARLVAVAPDAEFGWWADRERSGRGLASEEDVEDYLRGIGDRTRGFYSNIGECPRSAFLDTQLWWMADYGPNDGTRHDPNEEPPRPQRGYTIHQYTSAGGLDKNWADSVPAPIVEEEQDLRLLVEAGTGRVFISDGVTKRYIGNPAEYTMWVTLKVLELKDVDPATLKSVPDWVPPGTGGQATTGTITGTLTIP